MCLACTAIMDPETARYQYITVGPYELTHYSLDGLLGHLVDGGVLTMEQGEHYSRHLENHFYHGIMPGFTRFPVPPVGDFYFLPALRILWENYVAPPAQVRAIRLEWAEEVLSETDSLTLSDDSDLIGEDIDPDSVIDECLGSLMEFDMWLDPDSDVSIDGQDDGPDTI